MLTSKQDEILDYLRTQRGTPTIASAAIAFGVSPQTMSRHLMALRLKGLIDDNHQPRTLDFGEIESDVKPVRRYHCAACGEAFTFPELDGPRAPRHHDGKTLCRGGGHVVVSYAEASEVHR